MKGRPHFLEPLLRARGPMQLAIDGRNVRLANRIEPAFDSASRRRGLLGRAALGVGVAVVIAPSSAVHTFFMRFPIDLVFVRRDGVVLKVRERVPPWRLSAALGAFAVIELAAGTVARTGVRPSDRLFVSGTGSDPFSTVSVEKGSDP